MFVLAFIARLAYLCLVRPSVAGSYWQLSDSLLADGSLVLDGVKSAEFEPLYPIFLAASRLLLGDSSLLVQVEQIAVASLGAVFLYRLSVELTGRPRTGAIAAALFACYPLAVRQAVQTSEIALLSPFLILFAWLFVKGSTTRDAVVVGICLGLLVLLRTMTLPLVAIAAMILLARRRVRESCALTLAAALVASPIAIRNQAVSGGWLPTRSGVNFYIGNSPYSAALLPRYDLDLLQVQAAAVVARERSDLVGLQDPRTDRAIDTLLTGHTLAYMADDLRRTAAQKLLNVAYFFWPTLVPFDVSDINTRVVIGSDDVARVEHARPRPRVEHLSYTLSFLPILLGGLLGISLRWGALHRDVMLWGIFATFLAVSVWYFPATRYGAPVAFVLMFYASVALDRWIGYFRLNHLGAPRAMR